MKNFTPLIFSVFKKPTTLLVLLSALSLNALADEKSIYDFKWLDEGETVYVIQNKEHIKAKSIGVDFSVIDSDSSPYQSTNGFSLAITYYFSEKWSMDFTYKAYNNSDSADLKNLLTAHENQVKPLIRKVDAAKLIHFNWIPFYGKINAFNNIFFFDLGLGIGAGQFDTQGNYQTFLDKNKTLTFVQEQDTGFNLKTYFKFYTKSKMTFGFEYNLSGVSTINNPEQTKEVLYYADILATVGYLF